MRMGHKVGIGFAVALAIATGLADARADQKQKTVAVYPVVFEKNSGSDGSRKTAVDALRGAFEKAGYTLVSNRTAAAAWKELRLPTPSSDDIPRAEEVSRFGATVHADLVATASVHFHSRSKWVGFGPKTISTATLSVRIFDVESGKQVYEKLKVEGRGDEKENTLKAVGAVLLTPFVTVASGGPKTPQEQRAVQIAVARALKPYLTKK